MSGSDYLDRLESRFAESPHPLFTDEDFTGLRAALADLKRLQAEREAWLNGASQRLRHAYRSGWDDRARTMLAAIAGGGFMEAEERAAAYAAEWWDRGAALAAKIEAGAAPQQPERGDGDCAFSTCGHPEHQAGAEFGGRR